jgi:magnesium transporter
MPSTESDVRPAELRVDDEPAEITTNRRGIKTIEVDEELMRDIRELVRERAMPVLWNILVDLHPADIADIIDHLEGEEREFVFNLLEISVAGDVLLELDPAVRRDLLELLPQGKINALIERLDSDDAADILAELPDTVKDKVLRAMPAKEFAEVKELLQYPEDTAGGIMAREFVAVRKSDTVKKAIRLVREKVKEGMHVHNIFVVDDDGGLLGILPLQSLVLHAPNRRVHKIMDAAVHSVTTDVDQEEVANMFRKYDLLSLPVVDAQGHLVGRITIDDVVDVIEEEHTEDVARIIGSDVEELERRSPAQIAILRLPWVLMTLGIEFIAGFVVHLFDNTLGQVILLASFMPIISAISGNTGLQSAAIVIRGLGTGHVKLEEWWRPISRQAQTSLIIGGACGLLIGMIGGVWHGRWQFGLVVGLSMFFAINISGLIGTSVPMISKRLGFDPAITTGPFETAFQDVLGITIFLTMATLMLRFIV